MLSNQYDELNIAKSIHVVEVVRILKQKMCDINTQIEIAEEDGNMMAKDLLIHKRKRCRELIGGDEQGLAIANQIVDFTNIDQLKDHLQIYKDMD